jgi:hypothetical protein
MIYSSLDSCSQDAQSILLITTSEKKTSFLLIETYRKLINTQNYGHQDPILGGLSYMSGSVRISHFCEFDCIKSM